MEIVGSVIANILSNILKQLSGRQIWKMLAGGLALFWLLTLTWLIRDTAGVSSWESLIFTAIFIFGFAGAMWFVWRPDDGKSNDSLPPGPMVSVITSILVVLTVGLYMSIERFEQSCYRASPTLVASIQNQDAKCVEFWLEKDTNRGNTLDETVLHIAVSSGDPLVVGLLLAHGGHDPNVLNRDGITPLHLAVQNARLDIVCLLVSHGALTTFPSHENVTPLDLAAELKKDIIAERLRNGACQPSASQ